MFELSLDLVLMLVAAAFAAGPETWPQVEKTEPLPKGIGPLIELVGYGFMLAGFAFGAVSYAALAAFLLVVLLAVWWRSRGSALRAARAVPVALVAIVVLSPAALPWYYAWPLALALTGYWGVGFLSAYLLAFEAGLGGVGVWYGLALGLAVVAIALTVRFSLRRRLGLLDRGRLVRDRH